MAIFLNFFFSIPLAVLITWITALKLSGNTGRVANLVFLTPFISLIFIHFVLLGEAIEARTWAGLLLILIGICIQKYQEVKRF